MLKENQALAEKLYLGVLKNDPSYADTYRDLGFLYEQQGKYTDAAAQYRHYLAMVSGTSLDHRRVELRLANVQKLISLAPSAQ